MSESETQATISADETRALSAPRAPRRAELTRETRETRIRLVLTLDGTGDATINTGQPFFDHMLEQLARHSGMDLELHAQGDLAVDCHHTVEDCGIALGTAFRTALADKRGITRYGSALIPMDEALCQAAIDLSGRPFLKMDAAFPSPNLGSFETETVEEFLRAFADNARLTLHVRLLDGRNTHHMIEAIFKALARALAQALAPDPRRAGRLPSTKELL